MVHKVYNTGVVDMKAQIWINTDQIWINEVHICKNIH